MRSRVPANRTSCSEHILHRELNDAWICRGPCNHAKRRVLVDGTLGPLREIEHIVRIRELRGVSQIEELSAEMQTARFHQGKHSLHCEIHIVLAGAAHNAYSAVTEA